MRALVHVTLKKTVLDVQGKTIQGALKKQGYQAATGVRQGKYFEIELAAGTPHDQAKAEAEKIAREVLTNPVMEEFTCEVVE